MARVSARLTLLSARLTLLSVGVVLAFGCGGPHEIDENPASGAESEERAPAEPGAQESDDSEPEQPASEEPEPDPSEPQ